MSITDVSYAYAHARGSATREECSRDRSGVVDRSTATPRATNLRLLTSTEAASSAPLRYPGWQLALQRAFDLVLAAAILLIAAPMFCIVAAAVRLTSRGPVIFRHERVGRGGKVFQVMKFRTMRDGTHEELLASPEMYAEYVRNDFKLPTAANRITFVGKILRKTSLDELPQLINVLKGEMSIVGVRPLVPQELAMRPMADQERYRRMRPGMTGLWQISGRSTVSDEERFQLDRDYLDGWSVWRDIVILARTPVALLKTEHAA